MPSSKIIQPPRLQPGDKVAVCAPSGPAPDDELSAGVEILQSRYEVVRLDLPNQPQGYLAGTDNVRIASINEAFSQPEIRAVFASRGGYGAMRILQGLNAKQFRSDPKLIVGFSDITCLLWWALQKCGVRSIHGPVVTQLPRISSHERDWLFRCLEDSSLEGELDWELDPIGAESDETVSGVILGGNLCMVSHLSGTTVDCLQGDKKNKILFFEDVHEQPYAVDRILTGLKERGSLETVLGVVVGDFVQCSSEKYPDPTAMKVVDERLRAFGIPGLCGAPIGHGNRNRALPLGGNVTIDFGKKILTLMEAAVS